MQKAYHNKIFTNFTIETGTRMLTFRNKKAAGPMAMDGRQFLREVIITKDNFLNKYG